MRGLPGAPKSFVRPHVSPALPNRSTVRRALSREEPQLTPMDRGKGLWYIGGQTWNVGERYKLHKIIGHGSFSSVCLAQDKTTGELIALKRIGDVLSSPHNARRVLREVCILRRVSHPNIIGLRDVFLRPASTGPLRLRGGCLVPASLDIYIGMEYADRGDLYSMRGQLSLPEVKAMMHQLLGAVRYLHSLSVWHRDIKSANVLLTSSDNGVRKIMLADLGSARSAAPQGYSTAEQPPALLPTDARHGSPGAGTERRTAEALYARPKLEGGGFVAPLTGLVQTPCYRAPEVVMSRGGYTAALDMWSVGCILGELLQRVAYLGKASTPHLSVAPVFAMNAMPPPTPREGESYEGGAGDPITRLELEALFAVIGTPTWACIEAVASPAWRRYLRRLRGRAPQLFRRFGPAGEPAVDLLARLLTFDPARRATAEEAMAHEFFNDVPTPTPVSPTAAAPAAANAAAARARPDFADAVASRLDGMDLSSPPRRQSLQSPASPISKRPRPSADAAEPLLHSDCSHCAAATAAAAAGGNTDADGPTPMDAGPASPANGPAMQQQLLQPHNTGRSSNGGATAACTGTGAADSSAGGETGTGVDRVTVRGGSPGRGEPLAADPARALAELAELEEQMAAACRDQEAAVEALRALLVAECEDYAQQRAHERASEALSPPLSPTLQGSGRSQAFNNWEPLKLDPAASRGSTGSAEMEAEAAKQRVPNHADALQAKVDPEQHLRRNRHTEWAPTSLGGPPGGPSWGVTLHPPGVAPEHVTKEMEEVLRRQNKR